MPPSGTAPPYSTLDHLECSRCGATHDAHRRQGLCPACQSPLLARCDLAGVRLRPGDLSSKGRDPWRYHELLPVRRLTGWSASASP